MDEEIRQLLHSLDTLEAEASTRDPDCVRPSRVLPLASEKKPFQRRNWRVGAGFLVVLLGCSAAVGICMTSQHKDCTKRVVESSNKMDVVARNRSDRSLQIAAFGSNDLKPTREVSLNSSVSVQYDLSSFANERMQSLKEISANMREVAAAIIASPDLASHQVLRHLVSRFEQADVCHTNKIAAEIQERRSLLKTQKERQDFEAAMSCMGFGNVGGYQRRSDEISVASVLLENCVATLKSSKDVVAMAKIVRAATRLFDEMNTDTLASALIDLKNREKEMLDAARISTEKLIVSLLETKKPEEVSKEERESIAYLYAVIPSMDPKTSAVLYEPPASKMVQKTFRADNNLSSSDPFVASRTLYLASEGICSVGR